MSNGDEFLRIKVSDNGCGVDKIDQKQHGNTLGMQLITNLSDQLDAKIDIESEPGKGTGYVLTIKIH